MSTRFQTFNHIVTVRWRAAREAQARAFLLDLARQDHERIKAEQSARAGVTPDLEVYANTPGRPMESVTLPGPIVARFDYRREIVKVTLDMLRDKGPVNTGAYRVSHKVFVNGTIVDQLPAVLGKEDEILIAALTPYTRRLEVGKTKSGGSFAIKEEHHGFYGKTSDRIYDRYRKVAVITYTYGDFHNSVGLTDRYTPQGIPRPNRRRLPDIRPKRLPTIKIKHLSMASDWYINRL